MRSIIPLFAILLIAAPVTAQSGPRFAFEGGLLYATLDGNDFDARNAGVGFQAQGRLGLRSFSLGAGFMRTSHGVEGSSDDLIITGFILEPRVDFSSTGNLRPFLSGRFGILHQSLTTSVPGFGTIDGEGPGSMFGAGGGIAFRMAPAVELNLSATYNRLSFGDVTVNGSKSADSATSGSSVTLQVGLGYIFGRAQSAYRGR